MATPTSGWVSKTHRAIPPFDLVRPRTIEEAVAARAAGGAFIAGGVDQIQFMKDGPPVARLIVLNATPALADIVKEPDAIRFGACVTHHRIETDPIVARALPDLAAAWTTVGNIRVRMAGTLGGNIMAQHPNYDGPVLLAAAGATLQFAGADGETAAPVASETDGPAPDDALLIGVRVPLGARLAFDRSLKPAVTVAVALDGGRARGLEGRIAVGCAFDRPICRRFQAGGVAEIANLAEKFAALLPPPKDDAFASGAYRRRMAAVLIRRHLTRLAEATP
jgi:carbon-monoxide dehydrogenase medium subunit